MTGVYSFHSNHHEDRVFKFQCGTLVSLYKLINCGFTGFVNNYDDKLHFTCPNNRVIRS